MTSSSYTSEPFWPRKMFRNMPLGDGLVARIAQHEALATMLGTSEALATEWLAAKPDLKTMKRDDLQRRMHHEIWNHRASLPVPRVACRAQVGGPDETRKARTQEANQKIIVTPIRDI